MVHRVAKELDMTERLTLSLFSRMGGRFSVVFPDPMSPCSLSFCKFYNLGWNIRNSIHYSLLEDGWSAIRLITQKDGGNFACLNSSLWLPAPVIRHWACVWTIRSIQTQAEDGITDIKSCYGGLPGGSDGKESPCNAGYTGLILELERSPGEGNENSLQYSCLVNSMHRGVRHDWMINTSTKEGYMTNGYTYWASLMAQQVKNLPAVQETQEMWVWCLGWEGPLEKGMATHSSILA